MKKFLILLIVVIIIGVLWWLVSPFFINKNIDEDFPVVQTGTGSLPSITIPSETEIAQMSQAQRDVAEKELVEAYRNVPDTRVDEAVPEMMSSFSLQNQIQQEEVSITSNPPQGPTIFKSGSFVGADRIHQAGGLASIITQGAQSILRFENFSVTNGPQLRVYLSTTENPTNRDGLGDFIDLGKLKGNVGNQNYIIPDDVDLSQYNSVVIYCKPFHVVFGSASLR